MNTNQRLLELTAAMPMKQINLPSVDPEFMEVEPFTGRLIDKVIYHPYLQRYYVGTFRDGKDLWLHRFLSNDGDRYLHCHPFNFVTIMLNAGYTEEYLSPTNGREWNIITPMAGIDQAAMIDAYAKKLRLPIQAVRPKSNLLIEHATQSNQRDVFDWHRIASVEPETWTAVIVDRQRLPFWHFKKENDEYEAVRGSSPDWWKNYGVRPASGIASDDNRLVKL